MTAAARAFDAAVVATQTEMFGADDASTNAAIRASATVLEMAQQRLVETVNQQRSMGATWQTIGDALGITRQWAQQRFGKTGTDDEMGTE